MIINLLFIDILFFQISCHHSLICLSRAMRIGKLGRMVILGMGMLGRIGMLILFIFKMIIMRASMITINLANNYFLRTNRNIKTQTTKCNKLANRNKVLKNGQNYKQWHYRSTINSYLHNWQINQIQFLKISHITRKRVHKYWLDYLPTKQNTNISNNT